MYVVYFYHILLSSCFNMFSVVKRTEGSVIHCALYNKSRFYYQYYITMFKLYYANILFSIQMVSATFI